jgi:pyruvate dehydrogenase E2 component (dihydrolipoamide acetyltransferase)
MPDVVMPRLSDSMEEGTILKWLKADGEQVARGEELVEIETDKATMTYEADAAGVLRILAQEGETLPIGAPIAQVGDGGAAAPSGNGQAAATAVPAPAATAPAAPVAVPAPVAAAVAAPVAAPAGERAKASPVARRIARERGIDLSALVGTGPGGRIVKADVEGPAAAPALAAPSAAPPPPPPAGAGAATGAAKGEVSVQELSRTQQTIARRMAESKATIPEFTLQTRIDMHEAVALRSQLKALFADSEQPVPSYNDMVVKACALALREHPRANGSYKDARFELYGRVNVGVAVAAHDALVVPTVFDADRKSLGEIARETRALAERVRAGAVTPPELSGGTFTVSNLGMFGIADFTAVINPPQAAILAVGELAQQAVVRDGEIVARHQMHVTLACDHRILYGADAAQFLGRVRALLETPLALTL